MSSFITSKQSAGSTVNPASPLGRGLVGFLPMNERGGSKVNDIVANYYDGYFRGTPSWVGSPWGSAIKLNGTTDYLTLGLGGFITGATNATPIVITSAGHGLQTGRQIVVHSVNGNTAANGTWTITRVDADSFSLDTSVGNGAFTAGAGVWVVVTPSPNRVITNGSLAIRFKAAGFGGSPDNYLISRVRSGAHNYESRLYINNSNSQKLLFGIESTGGAININGDNTLLVDTWYHVVCVWQATVTNSQKMYVNGILQAGTATPANGVGVVDTVWNIGRNNALNTSYFNGTIESLMFYDRVLSQAEINALYATPQQIWNYPSWQLALDTPATHLGEAALADVSTLAATAAVQHDAVTSLSAEVTLTADGDIAGDDLGVAALENISTLTAVATVAHNGIATLTTVATVTADAVVPRAGVAVLTVVSTITPFAKVAHAAICWGNRLGILANTAVRDEFSGITRSNIDTDLFWGLNDSGGATSIFAMGRHGEDRGAWVVSGATNVDWEDISSATVSSVNYIYVGDIGDNGSAYSTHKIYRIIEPVLSNNNGGTISSGDIETITYQYPNSPAGETYVGNPARRDAETLAVDPLTGDMYVFSKRESQPRIFKLAHAASYVGTQTVTYVGQMQGVPDAIGGFTVGNAVGGDFSPDGLEFLIKTYDSVYFWRRTSAVAEPIDTWLLEAPYRKMPYVGIGLESNQQEPQGEAIAFDHDQRGYITVSETSGNSLVYVYYYSLGDQVNALGGFIISGAASLAAVATVTSAGSVRREASAALSNVVTVTAAGGFSNEDFGVAALSGVCTLTGTASVAHNAAASLLSEATILLAIGELQNDDIGAAVLASVSTIIASASFTYHASAALTSTSTLSATPTLTTAIIPTGGASAGGSATVKYRFRVTKTFKWNTGECIPYHYRVESPCIDINCETSSVDDGNVGCPSRLIAFVTACSLKELCMKLADRNFTFPILSIKRWSIPANRSDITTELDSCATYTPISDFSQVPECLNFGLAGDLAMNYTFDFSVEFYKVLGGIAQIEMGGQGAFTGSARKLQTSSDGGITLSGEGTFQTGNYLGDIEFNYVYDLSTDVTPSFLTVEDELPVPNTDTISTDCVCSVPALIQISHNLGKTGKLSDFLLRNSLDLPKVLNLTYSVGSESWTANSFLSGVGENSNHAETWNITFQWKCTNSLGPYDLGPTLWVLTIYIVRKNITLNRHFDTKLLFGFSYDQTCLNQTALVFKFNLNTDSEEVVSNSGVDTELKINYDNIGLFTSNSWLNDPILKIGISSTEGEPVLERFDLRQIEAPTLDL